MKRTLIYIGGSKGGTGKSIVSMALIDYLRRKFPSESILLFETDQSNPDVGRLYDGTPGIIHSSLLLDDKVDGWVSLLDEIGKQKESRFIVINSMAASSLGIAARGTLLDNTISEEKNLDLDFITFWVMNRTKDSVILLRQFLEVMKTPIVYPVLNLYFGKVEDFAFFKQNKDLQELAGMSGGIEIHFPNLYDIIADKLYTDGIKPEDMESKLGLGQRRVFHQWIIETKEQFDRVFNTPNGKSASASEQGKTKK